MKRRNSDSYITEELIRGLGFFFSVGTTIGLSLVLPTGIGWWFDQPEQLNSHPLYTLIGFAFGTVLAGYSLFRMLRQFQQKSLERNEQGKKDMEQ